MTREEFKICFDEWFDELRNYITYRCCDGDIATDIVQDAYTRLWEKQLEYQGTQTRALLYKIAKELWVSQYRKSKTAEKYQLQLEWDTDKNQTEEQLDYLEMKKKYEQVLSTLPEKRRTVFMMSRMDEMTYQEIADKLSISVKAVEKRMKLALEELRQILDHG